MVAQSWTSYILHYSEITLLWLNNLTYQFIQFLTDFNNNSEEIEAFFGTDENEKNRIANTCLSLCNLSIETSNERICAYYLSAIMCIFPGIKDTVSLTFDDMGFKFTIYNGLQTCTKVLEEEIPSQLIVMIAQSILILFKDISPNNYDNYMKDRYRELSTAAECHPRHDEELTQVAINVNVARVLRACLASQRDLRVAILEHILKNRGVQGSVGGVMRYLAWILEWNEMMDVIYIFEAIILPKSVIVHDSRIEMEMVNLSEAIKVILKSKRPPYYRILYPLTAARILETSKFPTLLAVAQSLRHQQDKIVSQSSSTCNNRLVSELVRNHKVWHLTDFDVESSTSLIKELRMRQWHG